MSQYPFPQQGYPQQYPQQPQQQPYPQQPYQQPFQPPYAPPQAPQQPLATGSLEDYYGQPSVGGGPSLSWKDKPIGTSYAGIVARDVTNADVQQQTNMRTGQPEFYRDGRPKFVLKVPLKLQPSPEFPEGEATWFVKGQARDELVRAMTEAGQSGSPKAGAGIVVTLTQRRPTGQGMNPANIVAVRYVPAEQMNGGQQPAPQQAPAQPAPQTQPPASPQSAPAQQPAPQQVPQQTPQPPGDLAAEQQALLAKLSGGFGGSQAA